MTDGLDSAQDEESDHLESDDENFRSLLGIDGDDHGGVEARRGMTKNGGPKTSQESPPGTPKDVGGVGESSQEEPTSSVAGDSCDEDMDDIEGSDASASGPEDQVEWVAACRWLPKSRRHVVGFWGPDGQLSTAATLCSKNLVQARAASVDAQVMALPLCYGFNGSIE